ncbi:RagB/SusD family nutrient uptake outer membrane protein [termite gut metagenome]|uniref:RagB/SusD family nutrient uptake outer membrane protein n=1 Tax=termite gut metagenome TaxID=433724 RepID=A0A5J4SSC1_9ZZZZ
MKTKIIFLALMLPFVLSINLSCSDSFLDEKPYSSYASETLTDAKGIEASLKGLHYTLGQLWTFSDRQGWLCCWQVGTDVASPGGIEGVEIPFFRYAEMTSENAAVKYMWQKCYEVINNANIIIQALEETDNSSKIAEAKFFRGYAYNILVTLYGAVPLSTTPTATAKTDYTRTLVSEVDAQITEDLKYASQYLPDINELESESRANKYMAMQVLGEAYLRMNKPDDAENVLSAIINDRKFSIIKTRFGIKENEAGDYFHDMFIYGNQRRSQGNAEAIWTFELEYNKNVAGGFTNAPQHRRVWVPAYHNEPGMTYETDSLGGRGNGRMRPSDWVKYRLYDAGDMRNSEYNIKRHFYYNAPNFEQEIGIDKDGFRVAADSPDAVTKKVVKTGDPVVTAAADSLEVIFPYSTKWNSFDPSDSWGWECIKDFPMMRLGETYLLRAEARFKKGDLSGAADDINVLRERAFGASYPAKGKVEASQITSLNFILDERARELFAEENRRMTLMRTGTLVERAKLNTESTIKGEITGLEAKHLLLPIPLDEIQRNKDAVLEQNAGYN